MRALVFALAFMLAAPNARAEEIFSIEAEVARVLRDIRARAPFESWDALRAGAPLTVNWHLAAPDANNARVFRRPGWISIVGRQAGIAACGTARGPELFTVRMAVRDDDPANDPVLALLRAQGVNLQAMPAGGEREMYAENGEWGALWFERRVRCTPEGAARAPTCSASYIVNVRPDYASAPLTRVCEAP